ncbi:MAG TPA: hypothetical protein VI322_03765 [Candidatus Saccharimonadia bacterium]
MTTGLLYLLYLVLAFAGTLVALLAILALTGLVILLLGTAHYQRTGQLNASSTLVVFFIRLCRGAPLIPA